MNSVDTYVCIYSITSVTMMFRSLEVVISISSSSNHYLLNIYNRFEKCS